jgi:hypothetical protein
VGDFRRSASGRAASLSDPFLIFARRRRMTASQPNSVDQPVGERSEPNRVLGALPRPDGSPQSRIELR